MQLEEVAVFCTGCGAQTRSNENVYTSHHPVFTNSAISIQQFKATVGGWVAIFVGGIGVICIMSILFKDSQRWLYRDQALGFLLTCLVILSLYLACVGLGFLIKPMPHLKSKQQTLWLGFAITFFLMPIVAFILLVLAIAVTRANVNP